MRNNRNINVDIFSSTAPVEKETVAVKTTTLLSEKDTTSEKASIDPAIFGTAGTVVLNSDSTTVIPQVLNNNHLPNVIDIKNVTQIFNQGKENEYKLFENFNLSIEDIPDTGQLVSIMGASGCGKSRLVRAICGLDTVQSGDINIYETPLAQYKTNIPMVFQTYSNYEWMTVLENVMLPMKIHGIKTDEAKRKATELLSIVGLAEHANKYPSKLSGGQQQRVSIARSLACNSQIIVFDEATGALDIKMKREVQNIILKIFYDSLVDSTILNITHSIEEAAYISNSVGMLHPNPCKNFKEIKIHYTDEEVRKRGEWIFETQEYAEYVKEITQAMDEVCK